MIEFFQKLFTTDGFMPHGHCYMWEPLPFWLNVLSDGLIAISYFTIPFGLFYFVRQRKDVDFRNLFYLFASFILLCGITHVLDIVGMWHPLYRLEGVANLATGIVSATTAIVLWRIIPQALKIPHPRELAKAQEQLMQEELARKQAEVASDMKSRFLADMSHEIRSPMSGVVMPLEVLQRLDLPPQAQEMVKVAKSSSQRMIDLIEDLLDLSKIEAGKLELHPEVFDNKSLVEEAFSSFEVICRQKSLNLVEELDETVPVFIKGDKGRTLQILTNLLGNAVKFTSEGHIKLRSTVLRKTGDVVEMRYCVEDTGIGIPKEDQERIFRPFSQQSSGTAKDYGGTGLGLAIAGRLAELMNGEITVDSEPDNGSAFSVRLRFEAASPEEIKAFQKKSQRLQEMDLNPSPHPSRILLLEDLEANIISSCALLQSKKHHVDVAHNLKEARQLLGQHQYKVIVLDLRLPDGNGLDLIPEIRERDTRSNDNVLAKDPKAKAHRTSIVILSAQAMVEDRDEAFQRGCDDYLTKPLTAARLISTVEKLVAE